MRSRQPGTAESVRPGGAGGERTKPAAYSRSDGRRPAVPALVAVGRGGRRHDLAEDGGLAADGLGRPALGRGRVGGEPRGGDRGAAGAAVGGEARRRGPRLRTRESGVLL